MNAHEGEANVKRTMSWMLAVAAVLGVAGSAGNARACEREKETYVLVHGAFHGGWAWQKVAEKLRQDGHRVYTPTLTGVGERNHLARPDVNLETHIQDVISVLEFEDLERVILVGHSYAGVVITGVASRVPQRIAKLVYFDAVVPDSGQSFFDAIGFNQPLPPDLWYFPSFPAEAFGLTDPADLDYVRAKITPQPIETFRSPVTFDWATMASIPKAYVHCLGNWFAFTPFLTFRQKALNQGWGYYEINTGHDAMISEPKDTAKLLRQIAR
ncbi:MAG: alpha/beta hydrolase [Myxococcales bacterium]